MVNKKINQIRKNVKPVTDFLSNKKVQNILVALLLIATIFVGVSIRLQTLPNLIDPTTEDYTPLALDPYYFMRVAETLVANDGELSGFDEFRSPHLDIDWTKEITPQSTVLIYNVMKVFNPDTTIGLATVLNPVIFFGIGLIIFFLLIWFLSNNKWIATISTFLLSIIPPYLYRTLTGFADHEAIGMVGFFLALLGFSYGMKLLSNKEKPWKIGLVGAISGIFTMFAIVSWGGGAKFLFMILPLAFLAKWVLDSGEKRNNSLLFYVSWFVFVLIGSLIFNFGISQLVGGYLLGITGLLTIFALGYIIINYFLEKSKRFKKYNIASTIGLVIVAGLLAYQLFVGDAISLFLRMIEALINPFGTGRVSLTVAENKQPYLSELISQVGPAIFWIFIAGCAIVAGKLSKGIPEKKYRIAFTTSFILFLSGILFTRLSPTSLLNGNNFLSKALFFISFLIIVGASIYIYRKSKWQIDYKWLIIAAWMIPMLLGVRSAIRTFFAIVPFISFISVFTVFEICKFAKKNKDDVGKIILWIIGIAAIIGLLISAQGYYLSINSQAKVQGPSYNADWQKAMEFVRENTTEGGKFLHWWDYGYWVQTGGDRPTVTDGGHSQGPFGDHLVGRYVLTTPYPETAKSFIKSHEVSYLLIDPTDIGKYGAYSSIGTGKDEDDRSSWIATLISNPSEIQETRNGTIRIYQGGSVLDGDLVYTLDGKEIFLPKGKAGIGAIILEKTTISGGASFIPSQPIGVFVYNGQRYDLPLRFLFINGELIDFGSGVESTAYLFPNVVGQQFDMDGAALYLSEKTKDSLVAKLYLMNDPKNEYSELELVYSGEQNKFPFYYGGFRGPIKIWDTNTDEMDNILVREEFLRKSGEFAEFDELEFTN